MALREVIVSNAAAVRKRPMFPLCGRGIANNVNTVDASEIELFSRLSSQWWDEHGEFAMLHKMNPVRMEFIKQKLQEVQWEEGTCSASSSATPLEGLDILDVGCGGGLLSESLARLGARTTGIDASEANIGIASTHAVRDPQFARSAKSLKYLHTTAEALLAEGKQYDVVCSMEVIEHVNTPSEFLHICAQLVKPGGHLFLSTISRTPVAYALTILAVENVLGIVTPGTHTYSKYIKPSELLSFFQEYPTRFASKTGEHGRPWITRLYNGLPSRKEADVRGLIYVPWDGRWTLTGRSSTSIDFDLSTLCNYIFWVRKPNGSV
ncbi:ubiquinone biosynthesis O-methyltransferase [Thelephora ganbajun]|uniref:Ubiquinone biosynthesis O-methyltransferase n=1 Tax=Thelephora ganbajun TaxID=370292 RepID=A0ACB6ZCP9_THEGA|nr:ubiquinone biosynthesis O-methyltransferase [Thelephora ganbajun]